VRAKRAVGVRAEFFVQNDPDAYSVSGSLNCTTQGLMEFVEVFKAPIKMLHPLLTATQEGNYVGSENIGGIPYRGTVHAHSNEAEWQSFKNNRNNEAFIDRISVIKVPYCLRPTEERKIYEPTFARYPAVSRPGSRLSVAWARGNRRRGGQELEECAAVSHR
jgi:serine protein kinase